MKIISFVLMMLYFACGNTSSKFETNVPSERLSDSIYTSPNLTFKLRVPSLVRPGAKVDEHVLEDSTRIVSFFDDIGQAYYLIEIPNKGMILNLDSISTNFPSNDAILDTHYVSSNRGTELRVTAVKKGAGLSGIKTIDGKTEEFRDDMLEIKTIFLHKDFVYDLTVGQSTSDSSKYKLALNLTDKLAKFVEGLRFE